MEKETRNRIKIQIHTCPRWDYIVSKNNLISIYFYIVMYRSPYRIL